MKEELLDACWEGKIEKVRRILQLQPHLVESQDKEGNTPLHAASYGGNSKLIEFLIESNAYLYAQDKNFGNTPLHLVSEVDFREAIALYLFHGVEPRRNFEGKYPYEMVKSEESQEVHKCLFEIFKRKQYKHNKFVAHLTNQQREEAKKMIGSQSQESVLIGAFHCLLIKSLLNFLKELPIEDYNKKIKNKTLIDVAVNLRNKEAFEYLVQKCGGNQKLFNYFCEVYRSDRVDDVKWLWKAFPDVLNKLPLCELFYSPSDLSVLLLEYFLGEPPHYDIEMMFDDVSFSSPKVKIPPSPLITNQIVDLFPWRSMADSLTHLDLSNCHLTELPIGFCHLDEHKIVDINLFGNPFSDVVVRAVVREGSAKDIIMMVKELKGGGVELKEKKVLVVGDAAVGKTTLLRGLRGENEVAAKVATDGIEIGELRLEGVVLSCWDFAGQEVYRYTHQLFLSGNSIYVVLFDLSQPFPSISSQLTYWLDSIGHRTQDSEIILVGTHASVVPRKKTKLVLEQVVRKFGRYATGDVLVVDSLNGEGLENMKTVLSEVAKQNLPRVPRLFEEIRQSFQQYRDSGKGSHFVEEKRLKQYVAKTLEGLTDESWEWCLRVLNCVGGIVLIDRDIYEGNRRFRSTFVIVRPSWLVDMFKTVVTMRHNFVKDGIISMEGLRKCWKEYDSSMHDLLLEALEKFDVVCRLSGRGGDKAIVPCLLPDCAPDDFFGWTQNGERAWRCLGRVGDTMMKDKVAVSSTFRRSFLLKIQKSQKSAKSSLPVGVMGKVLCSMFQWGKVRYAWKTGCVVVCGDNENKVVAMMWEGDCGGRAGVHFVFCGDTSPSSSLGSSSSFDKSCSSVRGLLQQVTQLMKNLFEDFYKVDYEGVVPCSVDQQGVPVTWVNVNEILVSIYQSNSKVSMVRRDGEVVEKLAIGGLAPDLMLDEDCVSFFDKNKIVFGRLLGSGAYGEVWEGEIPWETDIEKERQEEEEKSYPKTKKVAVKKILLDPLSEKGRSTEEILKELHHEAYLSLRVRHPNVVEMVGMCAQASPPLLLLELLDGKDLFSSLMDPLGLQPTLQTFLMKIGQSVREGKNWDMVISSSSGPSLDCNRLFEELRRNFARCPVNLQQSGKEFILKAIDYVNNPTSSKYSFVDQALTQVTETYKLAFEEIAPLSLTGVLRIAADISQGLHYLHSQIPSLLHRDLKGPNIFLTRRFVDGGGTEGYASKNIVAKLGDFGLSAVLCGPYQLRAQGNMKHINQRWAAPEILEGRGYSVESDVYSMGLVFWETRYREIAYHDIEDFLEKLKVEISKGTRPKLSFLDKFDEIMEKCWCSSPSNRLTAQQAYSTIRSLSASLAPSLYPHLPPISTTSTTINNPQNSSQRGVLVKTVDLPKNIDRERSHRVSCLATCEGEVWGGCRSGFIFCYYDEEKEQWEEEKEGVKKKGGELVMCHESQLSGEEGGLTGVNAVAVDKGGLVWVGAENGWLSVWESGDGGVVGEEVKFLVSMLDRSLKKSMEKKEKQDQDSFLKLEFGVVSWKGRKRGEREKEGEMLLRDVKEVREVKGKLGGVGVVVVDKGGREREFELGEGEGRKALDLLHFALFCLGEKRVLKRVGDHDLRRRVMALGIAGGRVWSFDESLKIREWKATPDLTGKQKGIFQLSSLRFLDFSSLNLSFDLSQNPFSCFFPVGNEELYVIFKQFGVILQRNSSIIEGETEEGRLEMKRVWDIFGGEEGERGERRERASTAWILGAKKGGWKVGARGESKGGRGGWKMGVRREMNEGRGNNNNNNNNNKECGGREEVWCGVYFGLRGEVWVGTSEGWVWRKGEKMEKRKVEGGVRVMAVVGSQVWCGTTNGEIYRFDAINFIQLNDIKKEKEKEMEKKKKIIIENKGQITSFGVVSGGRGVWSGSFDRTISLWW